MDKRFKEALENAMVMEYRNRLAEMVCRGLTRRVEQGWFTSCPPLGYVNDRLNKTIVKDDETWGKVRRLWDKFLGEKCSVSELAHYADETLALKGKQSNKPLTREGVRRILTNPFYKGKFRCNGKTYDGRHPAMVTEEEFAKAQQLLVANSAKAKANTK